MWVGTTWARRNWRTFLSLADQEGAVGITRYGTPIAVIVSLHGAPSRITDLLHVEGDSARAQRGGDR